MSLWYFNGILFHDGQYYIIKYVLMHAHEIQNNEVMNNFHFFAPLKLIVSRLF